MKWHYAINREKIGPVEESELLRLAAVGVITDSTLVWHKGLTTWRPYAEVKPAPEVRAAKVELPEQPSLPPAGQASGQVDVKCVACGGIFPLLETVRFADDHVCSGCRPAYLEEVQDEREERESSAEVVREQHVKRERLIRAVGAMYYFLAFVFAISGIGGVLGGKGGMVFLLPIAVGLYFAGRETRQIRPRAKLAIGLVSAFNLLLVPLGSLIGLIVLYIAFSKEGRLVLSPEHGQVIEETPEIRPGTSWLAAGLLSAGVFIQLAKNG